MQGKLINLFDAVEKNSLDSLFIVHNSEVTKMTVSEILFFGEFVIILARRFYARKIDKSF